MKAVITFDTESLDKVGEGLIPAINDMKAWFEEMVAPDEYQEVETDEGGIAFGFLHPEVEVSYE